MKDEETMIEIVHPDDGVRWLAEPPQRKAFVANDWRWLADILRTRPGVWAEVARVYRHHWAMPLRSNGLVGQMKKYGCEVRTRSDGGEVTHIYCRWVGEPGKEADGAP